MSNTLAEASIIPFPHHRVSGGRATPLERVAALRWENEATIQSYAQIVFNDSGSGETAPAAWAGDGSARVLAWISWGGELWSVEPPARPGMRCSLHRRLLGIRIGDYASLGAALEAIPLIAEANPVSSRATAGPFVP
jgi:hypothetical protein